MPYSLIFTDFLGNILKNSYFSNHDLFLGRCKFQCLFKSCPIFWYLLIFWEISLKTRIFSNHALFFGRCKFHVLFKLCLIFYICCFFGNIFKKPIFSKYLRQFGPEFYPPPTKDEIFEQIAHIIAAFSKGLSFKSIKYTLQWSALLFGFLPSIKGVIWGKN